MNSRIGPQSPTHQDSEPDTQGPLSSDAIGSLDTSPVSLPSREAAEDLVKVYFQFTNLGMPLLHEPTFNRKLDLVYSMPRTIQLTKTHTTTESRIALFWVLEVFAIAILSKQRQDPARIPTWIADRYHATAIMALHEAGLPATIEGVQALLLIGLYAYHHPTLWDVWKTVGTAVGLAIELGLHQDPRSDHFDFLTLDNMRRTFWVAYGMVRNLSIALAMPSCIADGAIIVKVGNLVFWKRLYTKSYQFPSDIEDEFITADGITTGARHSTSKRITLHLFRYRQIQSEMQTALCNYLIVLFIQLLLQQRTQYLNTS
ncbi:hypothetical protein NM208_g3938 [Fusarium decemcellulare]|uniref:Uncharacterized protein n=1 Tax=Fusarium decemcellulare TaxID=57161 RepID=A0ACC1SMR5_9HYPO|nr:hypothetical protein NM208_g3938 [Fusarium decemcellulare]